MAKTFTINYFLGGGLDLAHYVTEAKATMNLTSCSGPHERSVIHV